MLKGLLKALGSAKFENPLTVVNFQKPYHFDKIITRCDQELGGYSTVNFTTVREQDGSLKGGRFSGILSTKLPRNHPQIVKSGWAMWRTKHKNANTHKPFVMKRFANYIWDWSPYHSVALRVRGDGRSYFVNVQTDNPSRTDLFQHRLFLNNPGSWETVVIPLADFVLTNRGRVMSQGYEEIEKHRVKSFGIGILDGIDGPYRLDVQWVKVMNGVPLADEIEFSRNENLKKLPDEAEKLEIS